MVNKQLDTMNSLFENARRKKEKFDSQISPLGFNGVIEEIVIKVDNNSLRTQQEDKYTVIELILLTKKLNGINKAHTFQIIKTETVYNKLNNSFSIDKVRMPLSLHLLIVVMIKYANKIGSDVNNDILRDKITEVLTICKIKLNNYIPIRSYIDKLGNGIMSNSSSLKIEDIRKELEEINSNDSIISNLFYTEVEEEIVYKIRSLVTNL